jgi:hypothetical protein
MKDCRGLERVSIADCPAIAQGHEGEEAKVKKHWRQKGLGQGPKQGRPMAASPPAYGLVRKGLN